MHHLGPYRTYELMVHEVRPGEFTGYARLPDDSEVPLHQQLAFSITRERLAEVEEGLRDLVDEALGPRDPGEDEDIDLTQRLQALRRAD